jgi:hypothetical protein
MVLVQGQPRKVSLSHRSYNVFVRPFGPGLSTSALRLGMIWSSPALALVNRGGGDGGLPP